MVRHDPDHDKDLITQAMVIVMKDMKEDHPLVQSVVANYAEIKRRIAIDPTCDPEDELGRYEYVLSRWKPN
jgi:hypothetical protein